MLAHSIPGLTDLGIICTGGRPIVWDTILCQHGSALELSPTCLLLTSESGTASNLLRIPALQNNRWRSWRDRVGPTHLNEELDHHRFRHAYVVTPQPFFVLEFIERSSTCSEVGWFRRMMTYANGLEKEDRLGRRRAHACLWTGQMKRVSIALLFSSGYIFCILMERFIRLFSRFIRKEHVNTFSCYKWNVPRSLCAYILEFCCFPVLCISFSTCICTIQLLFGLLGLSNFVALKVLQNLSPSTHGYKQNPSGKMKASRALFFLVLRAWEETVSNCHIIKNKHFRTTVKSYFGTEAIKPTSVSAVTMYKRILLCSWILRSLWR